MKYLPQVFFWLKYYQEELKEADTEYSQSFERFSRHHYVSKHKSKFTKYGCVPKR